MLNQRLTGCPFEQPEEVVRWLGAVQAQDYLAAKWALGLRLKEPTDASLDAAFNKGILLRTHVMRPTWHFLTPEDIRWMLALTAQRVHAANGTMYRKLELSPAMLTHCTDVLVKAMAGGRAFTREALRGVLEKAGIEVGIGQRLAYILMNAELNGEICSGPRRGKQFTYMLLDERALPARILARDEALAELVRRYFVSHGPATIQDFTWWSGLTVAEARLGLDGVKSQLVEESIGGKAYFFSSSAPTRPEAGTAGVPAAQLRRVRQLPGPQRNLRRGERGPSGFQPHAGDRREGQGDVEAGAATPRGCRSDEHFRSAGGGRKPGRRRGGSAVWGISRAAGNPDV